MIFIDTTLLSTTTITIRSLTTVMILSKINRANIRILNVSESKFRINYHDTVLFARKWIVLNSTART